MRTAVQQAWQEFCSRPCEEAFREFYEQTGGSVYTICFRILGDADEAKDALQSVYCDLLVLAHSGRETANIDEEVRCVAAREAERRRKRRWRTSRRTVGSDVLDSLEATTQAPDDAAADREIRSRVSEYVSGLAESYRIPIILSYFHGMSHEQIAEALDVPRRTVTRRIAEGLQKLETVMRKDGLAEVIGSLAILLGAARLLKPPAALTADVVYAHAAAKALAGATIAATTHAGAALLKIKVAAASVAVVVMALAGWRYYEARQHTPPTTASSARLTARPVNPPHATANREPQRNENSRRIPSRLASPGISAALLPPPPRKVTAVTGRVVSLYDKQPLTGVRVQLLAGTTAGNNQTVLAAILSDADGRFEFPPEQEGRYTVAFRPQEPWVGSTREAVVQYGIRTDLGDVALNRKGTIRGRVIKVPEEMGISNVDVTLRSVTSSQQQETVKTGPKGEFEFTNLSGPAYAVIADRGIKRTLHGALVRLVDSETAEVDIPFGSGILRGRVLHGGKPYERAAVRLAIDGTGITRTILSDANGVYEAPLLPPGQWRVSVAYDLAEPMKPVVDEMVLVAPTDVTEKDFRLPSGKLIGRVMDASDRPLSGTLITAMTTRQTDGEAEFIPLTADQVSNSDGSFAFDHLMPGTYRVFAAQAENNAGEPQTAVVPFEGDSATVALKINAREGGHLVSTACNPDGTPIRDAWCYLTSRAGSYDHGRVRNANGELEIDGVPPGIYDVEVSSWGYSRTNHMVTIAAGQKITLRDVLHEAGALRWGIRTPDGAPVADAQCRLMPVDLSSVEPPREGKTGPDGVWTVRGLLPGEYTATTTVRGQTLMGSVTVQAHDLTEKWSVADSQSASKAP